MMNTKEITIEAAVSITTGMMLTDFKSLHDAIQFTTGQTEDLASIGVVMMAPIAKERIMAQHPDLPTDMAFDHVSDFLSYCRKTHGEHLTVRC